MSSTSDKKIEFIKDLSQNDFDLFNDAVKSSEFLQTYSWGEFQKNVYSGVFRYGLKVNGELVVIATFIKKLLPFKKAYLYSPKGPIINCKVQNRNCEFLNIFLDGVINEHSNVLFLRIEPEYQIKNPKYQIQKTIDIQPAKTIRLDLLKTEDNLLALMHQKTRYNIRLASKKGLVVREGKLDDFNVFWRLMQETGERDSFRLHSRSYYERMLKELNNRVDLKVKMFIVFDEDVAIAVGLFVFCGEVATYLHGASASVGRNLMAPYLLQWTMIKVAKKNNYKYYDFYGVDEKKWPGVTRFKRGFGGNEIECCGTFDLVVSSLWYKIYNTIRMLKRK